MADEEGLEYAVQHVCLNCSELGKCDKGTHCEFLKIVRECYDDAIEIGRKENARLSKMLEMAINEVLLCGKQMKVEHPSMIVWTEETFRAELEKRVENVK